MMNSERSQVKEDAPFQKKIKKFYKTKKSF